MLQSTNLQEPPSTSLQFCQRGQGNPMVFMPGVLLPSQRFCVSFYTGKKNTIINRPQFKEMVYVEKASLQMKSHLWPHSCQLTLSWYTEMATEPPFQRDLHWKSTGRNFF